MSSNQQFLQNLYEAFNNRELETIISVMHPDVKWANGVEGGFVYGRDAVREYWTNQYKVIQMRVLDKTRLIRTLGQLSSEIITQLEDVVLLTLGYES